MTQKMLIILRYNDPHNESIKLVLATFAGNKLDHENTPFSTNDSEHVVVQ